MIKLNKEQEKILYNFVNSIGFEDLKELIKYDKDFKFTANEYDEVFDCIYEQFEINKECNVYINGELIGSAIVELNNEKRL